MREEKVQTEAQTILPGGSTELGLDPALVADYPGIAVLRLSSVFCGQAKRLLPTIKVSIRPERGLCRIELSPSRNRVLALLVPDYTCPGERLYNALGEAFLENPVAVLVPDMQGGLARFICVRLDAKNRETGFSVETLGPSLFLEDLLELKLLTQTALKKRARAASAPEKNETDNSPEKRQAFLSLTQVAAWGRDDRYNPWDWLNWNGRLFPEDDLAFLTPHFAAVYDDEFFWTLSFDRTFLKRMIYESFLPMALVHEGKDLLTPKLHLFRSTLDLKNLHVGKTVRRKSKNLYLSVNACFEEVLNSCAEVHGAAWLTEKLRATFTALHKEAPARSSGWKPGNFALRFLSFEVWDRTEGNTEDGVKAGWTLVAGEIGYLCGAVYTSLSGYKKKDSAGTVQMLAMASYLYENGVKLWDLGMPLPYKLSLGAENVGRLSFLARQNSLRDKVLPLHKSRPLKRVERIPCYGLLAKIKEKDLSS